MTNLEKEIRALIAEIEWTRERMFAEHRELIAIIVESADAPTLDRIASFLARDRNLEGMPVRGNA